MIPKKSKEGKWHETRGMGAIGENYIAKYLKEKNFDLASLNFYSELDNRENQVWDVLKGYPKFPDFIARNDEFGVHFVEVKTKRKRNNVPRKFWVNKRDYEHYLKLIDVCSVVIYFVFINDKDEVKELFSHIVAKKDYNQERSWDCNIVYDVDGSVKQLE